MTNPNAAKGARLELAVRRFLEEVFGRHVRRPRQEGFRDVGDLHLPPFIIQAKDWKTIADALRAGVNGAEAQVRHAGEAFGVAVVKYRGHGVAEARVAMTLGTFRRLAARLLRAEALLARHAPDAYAEHAAACKLDN